MLTQQGAIVLQLIQLEGDIMNGLKWKEEESKLLFGLKLLIVSSPNAYRYFAVGSADALVSLWDLSEMLCVRTFTKLE